MAFIEIPDGERSPIYFECTLISAVRTVKEEGRTYTRIWMIGDTDSWRVECAIDKVLELISKATGLAQQDKAE